ncbi:MAG: efflux RND transporter periplasmic adaptor subunit [Schwartzia sp.]|nr:efflux RND transporter periplasmic adaptor subunit [Schwartzia sp. (in: firmicutes)]
MKRYFFIGLAAILVLAIALVGYGTWLNVSDENQIARRMDERALTLTGAKVKRRSLHPAIEMDAVRLYSENMADAVALIDGRIIEWYVKKNSAVQKGDTLLRLENDQVLLQIQQATANVRRAEAALAQAFNTYRRQELLLADNATSKEKYDAAKAQYEAAQETLVEAEAQRDMYYVQEARQRVTSPVDGKVLLIYHREGSYVQGGVPLALVGDFDRLLFSTTLNDKHARYLFVGEKVTLKIPSQAMKKAFDTEYAPGNKGNNETIVAVVKEITPPISEPAGIRRVICEIDNRAGVLEPLTYNKVSVRAERSAECLSVPLSAMTDASRSEVFMVRSDGTIERRDVETGTNDGTYIEIRSGLAEGDVVVVENFDGLENDMRVQVTIEDEKSWKGGEG